MEWTEERIETLRALAGQGLTAGQIADHLGGVSRNAVIGKMNRLDRPSRRPEVVTAAPGPRPTPAPRRVVSAFVSRPFVEPIEPPGAVGFGGLTQKMCRWPIGDPATDSFSFCGADVGAGSYCGRHAVIAYPRAGRAIRPESR